MMTVLHKKLTIGPIDAFSDEAIKFRNLYDEAEEVDYLGDKYYVISLRMDFKEKAMATFVLAEKVNYDYSNSVSEMLKNI